MVLPMGDPFPPSCTRTSLNIVYLIGGSLVSKEPELSQPT